MSHLHVHNKINIDLLHTHPKHILAMRWNTLLPIFKASKPIIITALKHKRSTRGKKEKNRYNCFVCRIDINSIWYSKQIRLVWKIHFMLIDFYSDFNFIKYSIKIVGH